MEPVNLEMARFLTAGWKGQGSSRRGEDWTLRRARTRPITFC
jgi:hypothetical protein